MSPRVGDVLENPVTGERVLLRRLDEDVLELDDFWPDPHHRVPAHVHPGMEERWLVIAGRPCFRIDGVERRPLPGERLVAPAGVAHESWNTSGEPVHLRIQMRPGLRWVEFVERAFGLAGSDGSLADLMAEYPREISVP